MRKGVYVLAVCCAAVLCLALGVYAGSHEGEFTWYKVTGPGPYHVDVVSGHGKTCYVFTEEYERGRAGEQPVLLWCEPTGDAAATVPTFSEWKAQQAKKAPQK